MDEISDLAPVTQETDRDVMLRLCSLGNNCELGQAQRVYKAEPIDLFRWAATPHEVLMKLLRARFEGIGDPAQLVVSGKPGNLVVRHLGYGFNWHAFVGPDVPPEKVHAREVTRLPYLARKLMEEMQEASRTFAIKPSSWTPIGVAETRSLLRVMETFGGNPTLMLVIDGADYPTLEEVEPRLFVGRVKRFANQAYVPQTTCAEDWLALGRMLTD